MEALDMRRAMRWMVMAAVLMTAGMRVAQAATLIDPSTGIMVDSTTDPQDFAAVAGGEPGNIGMEATSEAEADAAQAAQAAQDAQAQAIAQAQQADLAALASQ